MDHQYGVYFVLILAFLSGLIKSQSCSNALCKRRDITGLEDDITGKINALENELGILNTKLEEKTSEVKNEVDKLSGEISKFNSEMKKQFVLGDDKLHMFESKVMDHLTQMDSKLDVLDAESAWTTYVRWGRTVCPATNGASVLYKGVAAGSDYSHSGGGSNYLCLPDDPEWQTYVDGVSVSGAYIYGAEYQFYKDDNHHVPFSGANAPGGDPHALANQDVPCVVCQIPRNTVMIPAKRTCPIGWTSEFKGYLVAERHSHPSNKEFVCMDDAPEAITGTMENKNGALFYSVQAVCGSLPCPKYINGRELTCVVCSK